MTPRTASIGPGVANPIPSKRVDLIDDFGHHRRRILWRGRSVCRSSDDLTREIEQDVGDEPRIDVDANCETRPRFETQNHWRLARSLDERTGFDHETLLDELLYGVRCGLWNEAGLHGYLSPADPLRRASNQLE
jgi:hypothetical protein